MPCFVESRRDEHDLEAQDGIGTRTAAQADKQNKDHPEMCRLRLCIHFTSAHASLSSGVLRAVRHVSCMIGQAN